MAQGRNYYTLETQAHRDGYAARDEDGRTLEADKLWKGWGAPEMLKMGFCECKEKVLEAWRAGLVSLFISSRAIQIMGCGGAWYEFAKLDALRRRRNAKRGTGREFQVRRLIDSCDAG